MDSENKKVLLSRNVVSSESIMYHDSLPSNHSLVSVGKERVSAQVEHLQKTFDNGAIVDDTHDENIDDYVVQHSSTILQQPN